MANTMMVQTRQAAISQVNQQIGQEKQKQALLESALSNNKNLQSQTEANLQSTVTTQNQTVKNTNLINLESQISAKKAECVGMLRKYQPDFPDVLGLQ